MPKLTGAELVVRALEDEEVPFTFGIPGAQNLELYDALEQSPHVRPILVTDEQSASFMADGVSRASGSLGCVNLVPGAGLTHALSGIAEAYMDNIPLLVLAAGIRSDTGKAFQLHDIDQLSVARPVTKAQFAVKAGKQIYETVREACRLARAAPGGPVIVEIPANLLLFRQETALEAWRAPEQIRPEPAQDLLEDVRRIIAMSRRPLLYLGLGSVGAGSDLVALAERLEAPVATTFQGKGVFPESHPLWLWCGFGRSAPSFVQSVAHACDVTIAIGCRFGEVATGSYGLEPPGKLIHVDVDATVFDRNYTAALAIESDASDFVTALLADLPARERDEELRAEILSGHEEVHAHWATHTGEHGVAPPRLFTAVQEVYGPDAVYVVDSGNGLFEAIECLRIDKPFSFLAPVDFSCMGYALPAGLGAALADPERPVVALVGDGAFLMTGLELVTAAQLKVPLSVIVLRDKELTQIAQFQETAYAHKTASELPDFDLADICRGLGVEHVGLRSDAEVHEGLAKARSVQRAGQPVLIEVATDSSQKTYFTRGVIRTNLGRLSWAERVRFVARALARRLPGSH